MPYLRLLPLLALLSWQACQNPAPAPAEPEETPLEQPEPDSAVTLPIDTSLTPLIDGYYQIDWNLLAKVEFRQGWHDTLNDYIYYPIFHPEVRALSGKPVEIQGYVIPFEETQDESILVLSAFPFSSCFFCGNAGPESVMDIQLAPQARKQQFKQDDQVRFRGRLRLNDEDVYYLNYILEEAAPAP